MNTQERPKVISILFYFLAFFSFFAVIFGSTVLTELGQVLNLPREWLIEFFRYRVSVSIGIIVTLAIVIYIQFVHKVVGKWLFISFLAMNVLGLFLINWFVADYWLRSLHLTAEYTSVEEANNLLHKDDDIFVLEINGDVRAFPRDWMMLPHFAGGKVGGEDFAMSYCVLSNLPLAFSSLFNGQLTNYKVIAQAHNNLIFTDRVSGELIQQITGTAEFSKDKIDQFPVQRMPWYAFRTLYPEGKVLRYIEPNMLDRITDKLFEKELIKHYEGKPIFSTLDLVDSRLPNGELVWGLDINGEQLAVAVSSFKKSNSINLELGGQHLLLAWFPEYETLGVFKNQDNTSLDNVVEIDPYGNTENGKLERIQTYPGVLWMIWSHWFPETKLLK